MMNKENMVSLMDWSIVKERETEVIGMKAINRFKSYVNLENVRDFELNFANFLADDKEAFDEVLQILINKKDAIMLELFKYSRKRIFKGFGQDITAQELQNLIEAENYDDLQVVLSSLNQMPFTSDDVEIFVAAMDSIEDIEAFLEKHRANLRNNIIYYLLLGRLGNNANEYFKFRKYTLRLRRQKESLIKRKSNKVSMGV